MYSKTIQLVFRLLKILSKERKNSLYKIIPLAIITGISDVLVVGLVSRLFVVLVGKENRPSIPYSELFTNDSKVSFGLFNWSELKSADIYKAAKLSTVINFSKKLLFAAFILRSIGEA